MDKKRIKFYVIVPVYKAEQFIQQCIESILNQTYQEFEIVLVDDGSPDQSGAICDAFAQMDLRIHVLHKKNEGQISARIAGISFVKRNFCDENSFFVFVDSDDYLEPKALAVLADVICEKNCDCVIYGMQRVCNGEIVESSTKETNAIGVPQKRELYKKVFWDVDYNSMCRKAVACTLILDDDWSEYYHIRYGEDLLQSIPIYKNCQNPYFINDVLYNYRMNPASVTNSVALSSYEVDSTVRRKVWEFLKEENVLTEQDIAEYLDRCRFFMRKKVQNICEAPGKYAEYHEILEDFRKDSYYSMLMEGATRDYILRCLKNGYDFQIIMVAKTRKLLASCYCFVKKFIL